MPVARLYVYINLAILIDQCILACTKQAKDERIAVLETENATLHIQVAQVLGIIMCSKL